MQFIKRFLYGHPIEKIEDGNKKGFRHKGKEYIHHSDLEHQETAFYRMSAMQKIALLILLTILIIGLTSNWHVTVVIFVEILTLMYFADLLFNLFLIIEVLHVSHRI